MSVITTSAAYLLNNCGMMKLLRANELGVCWFQVSRSLTIVWQDQRYLMKERLV